MDWTPAIDEARSRHAAACTTGHPEADWVFCPSTPAIPAVARELGLLAPPVPTLAERQAAEAAAAPPVDRATWLGPTCACGHPRRGHSVDGLRCFASPCTCQADGGFRQ
jgi:hypothetical protein